MTLKDRLITMMELSFDEIHRFAERMEPNERQQVGEVDNWSPRDVLAHLADCHRILAERLVELPAEKGEQDSPDFETINRSTWHAYYEKSFEQILGVLESAQEILLQNLKGIAESEFTQVEKYPWLDGRPLWRYITGLGFIHPIYHLRLLYIDRGDAAKAKNLSRQEFELLIDLDDSPDWKAVVIYNQACVLAVLGETAEAMEGISQSLRLAPRLVEWSQQDTDLVSLHETPEFKNLIAELTGNPV